MAYQWTGRDGVLYTVTEVTDSHLKFTHRIITEKLLDLSYRLHLQLNEEGNIGREDWKLIQWLKNKIAELSTEQRYLLEEISKRHLDCLLPRSKEERLREQEEKSKRVETTISQLEIERKELRELTIALSITRKKKAKIERELEALGNIEDNKPKTERKILLIPKPHED